MTTLAVHRDLRAIALPLPATRTPIAIREAELKDVAFIDALQKKHGRAVGWFPTKQIEGNIAKQRILIAEESGVQVGYCIAADKYLKREELGICYQLNVVPDKQRGLIGATLIKAVFDRAAYGCKLFCCWCAQDLEANRFWESLGFVPLALRTGSRSGGTGVSPVQDSCTGGTPVPPGNKKTPRIHIFWQRRIREGDTQTPYWFPSETQGGAIKENRLVLPIPPGTHWSDAKPAVLPGGPGMENIGGVNVLPPGAVDPTSGGVKKSRTKPAKIAKPPAAPRPKRGLWFTPPPPAKGSPEAKAVEKAEKSPRKREKFKHDPKHVAAARELRDRYLEQVNADGMLPSGGAQGKYDVSRQLTPPHPHQLGSATADHQPSSRVVHRLLDAA